MRARIICLGVLALSLGVVAYRRALTGDELSPPEPERRKAIVAAIQSELSDTEGIAVRSVGSRIFVEGWVYSNTDAQRVDEVMARYPCAKSFVMVSGSKRIPRGFSAIARRRWDDARDAWRIFVARNLSPGC